FADPRHPYTRLLRDAAPVADPRRRAEPPRATGEIPSAAAPPSGCHFHPRCPRATDICSRIEPVWTERDGQGAACHHPLTEPD
ncbi:MAG: oligopeptide/dipeptide ABC transporter ATP-binding protein, partial [Acetobacteraceae bacterium]